MSTIRSTELVKGEATTSEWVARGLLGVGFVAFVLAWAAVFRWLDPAGTYAGVALFDLLGGGLLVLAAGLFAAGLGSRYGYLETTPSDTAGLPVGIVFGVLYGAVAAMVTDWLVGGATLPPLVAGLALVGGLAVAVLPREDVGSTVPVAALIALAGGAIVVGPLGVGWEWTPGWSSALLPGNTVVPVVVMVSALPAFWSGAKLKAGFGAQGRQSGAVYLIGLTVFGMLSVLALLIGFIFVRGLDVMLTGGSLLGGQLVIPGTGVALPWVELPFLTNTTGGLFVEVPGVWPAVVGTLWLVLGAMLLAVPLGVGAAVFLTEYAEQGRFTQVVEVATNGLWSTPSIVFGLFGLAFLVPRISGGNSIVVGMLVLGFMLLPLVLITSREAIKAVPDEYRDASAALGATRWQTIRSVVVPAAMPGVITGVIIGVGRIAGETAPLLLVFGGSPYPDTNPNVLGSFRLTASPPFVTNEALLSPASALPYQLYSSITAGVFPKEIFTNTEFGWGTALVLLLVVIGLYAVGVGARIYFRRKLHHE
jgi:phosphate transport system permease protein